MKRHAVIVGSGAGGAVMAKELQGSYRVTILESGGMFRPMPYSLSVLDPFRRTGILMDERMIPWVFPSMRIHKSGGEIVFVSGRNRGGSTALSTGSAVRADENLQSIGIDLSPEFDELSRQIPVTIDHRSLWGTISKEMFSHCESAGFEPTIIPKMGHHERCRNCGRCMLGCRYGIKWYGEALLREAEQNGVEIRTGHTVIKLVERNGKIAGVMVKAGSRTYVVEADLIILSAGGFNTPMILERSGITTDDNLFVDPVLTVAAHLPGSHQNSELTMPFMIRGTRFFLSPYYDFLSVLFNPKWRQYRYGDIYGIMIKLADTPIGSIRRTGIEKSLTTEDHDILKTAQAMCIDIFRSMNIHENDIQPGTLHAGHPGGTLSLRRESAESFHDSRLPDNVYVADASLLPGPFGMPPILTIMALAKRIASICTLL